MSKKSESSVDIIWDQLAKRFNNLSGMKPNKSWFKTGMSERTGYKRVRILETGAQAQLFASLTDGLRLPELSYLRCRAIVNLEQAQAAARSATIFNATLIIGIVVVFNQIFPGAIGQMIQGVINTGSMFEMISGVLIFVCALIIATSVTGYSHAGVVQARDLKHLLDLTLAHKGNTVKMTSNQIENNSITTDLRKNFLSDV